VPLAVTLSVAVVFLTAGVPVFVRRRRRRPRIAETKAERALRARIEEAAAQERATRMHPDVVRYWMRPR